MRSRLDAEAQSAPLYATSGARSRRPACHWRHIPRTRHLFSDSVYNGRNLLEGNGFESSVPRHSPPGSGAVTPAARQLDPFAKAAAGRMTAASVDPPQLG